jgi:hypothetical protein
MSPTEWQTRFRPLDQYVGLLVRWVKQGIPRACCQEQASGACDADALLRYAPDKTPYRPMPQLLWAAIRYLQAAS